MRKWPFAGLGPVTVHHTHSGVGPRAGSVIVGLLSFCAYRIFVFSAKCSRTAVSASLESERTCQTQLLKQQESIRAGAFGLRRTIFNFSSGQMYHTFPGRLSSRAVACWKAGRGSAPLSRRTAFETFGYIWSWSVWSIFETFGASQCEICALRCVSLSCLFGRNVERNLLSARLLKTKKQMRNVL